MISGILRATDSPMLANDMTMTAAGAPRALTMMVWPSVAAWRMSGRVWLDRKYVDGMREYAKRWPGAVRALMHVEDVASLPPFGVVDAQSPDVPFALGLLENGQTLTPAHLGGVDLLLASADDFRQLRAAETCQETGTVCAYVIEYTLRTRLDMGRHSGGNFLQRLKTTIWHLRNEFNILRAVKRSDGVQANGLPAFTAYSSRAKSAQLYCDTRLRRDDLISADALELRLDRLKRGEPLRIAFSGRLVEIKGADALVPLAVRLRQLGVDFSLHVFGAGALVPAMTEQIAAQGLDGVVVMAGAVDFDSVLVPALKEGFDLFVCCHRQGDPSCTYAETFGCGVPMVGFANESLAAMVERHQVGWCVPMDDGAGLARLVAQLAADREEIARKSRNALRFASENHFEAVFEARVAHCVRLATASRRRSEDEPLAQHAYQ